MNPTSPASSTSKMLLDSPSTGPALGFDRTARALAQIVTDSDPRFAIGIFGGWGSGKTTLMEAIQRALNPDNVVIVPFNAWRFEREPQLLVPLIDTVRAALVSWSKNRDAETRERVRGVATRLAKVVRGLAMGLSAEMGVPGAVKIRYDVGKAVDELTSDGQPELPQSLYVAAFEELRVAFQEFASSGATRVVVFVDDLDRCLPSNALDVLESMKLFFDLPGFVFVVGLDEDVVQRAVRSRFSEWAIAGEAASAGTGAPIVDAQRRLERDYVERSSRSRTACRPWWRSSSKNFSTPCTGRRFYRRSS
jgi:predicted KAP-like P-loop ATPase